ncbi:phosphotransferase family protein [Halosegnis rubeus]|uniref:Phosphotransferase n=1 Tax=Halosegnis rubeus TaxID=2212850 RepID=A0A5N5UMQ4_9EURY|nr:phosphotransferase [Halosegnis rubeus]KAB7520209.1 phosphotransferase [Halosegnis rubeus]
MSDDAIDFPTVAGMVAACRGDWTLDSFERVEQGTDFVARVACSTPNGERRAVLKATIAEWMAPEIARAEPRLFELVGRETEIPVPEVYGFVDRHDEYPAPFYLVEERPGENFEGRPEELLPAARERVIREAGGNLAALHELGEQPRVGRVGVSDGDLAILPTDHDADSERELFRAGIDETCDALADGTYFPDYADEPQRFVDLAEPLRETLHARAGALTAPEPPRYCHWDYRYGNLLVDSKTGETTAVLDWANLSVREPAHNLASVESHLFDAYGQDTGGRASELRKLFRDSYESARDDWSFTPAKRDRMETYLLKCRTEAMACLPLWLEDATPREKAVREREHREYVEKYL